MSTYDEDREMAAKTAQSELLETVRFRSEERKATALRAVNYLVKNMGFNTVVHEQMPNWIFGHMLAFAQMEGKRARRRKDAP